MADLPKVGEQVTLLPPYDDDPYILAFQRYATVAQRTDAGYMIELDGTHPAQGRYGPFPANRLARGWRDNQGCWR